MLPFVYKGGERIHRQNMFRIGTQKKLLPLVGSLLEGEQSNLKTEIGECFHCISLIFFKIVKHVKVFPNQKNE